jgi:hypothetical protein
MPVQVDEPGQNHAVGFEPADPRAWRGRPDPHDRAGVDLDPTVLDDLVRRQHAAAQGERAGGGDPGEQRSAARGQGVRRRLGVLGEDRCRVVALERVHQPFPPVFAVRPGLAVRFDAGVRASLKLTGRSSIDQPAD